MEVIGLIWVYHYTKNDINYKFITISDYILSNYNTLSGFISSNKLDVTAINNAKDDCMTATNNCNTAKIIVLQPQPFVTQLLMIVRIKHKYVKMLL